MISGFTEFYNMTILIIYKKVQQLAKFSRFLMMDTYYGNKEIIWLHHC